MWDQINAAEEQLNMLAEAKAEGVNISTMLSLKAKDIFDKYYPEIASSGMRYVYDFRSKVFVKLSDEEVDAMHRAFRGEDE